MKIVKIAIKHDIISKTSIHLQVWGISITGPRKKQKKKKKGEAQGIAVMAPFSSSWNYDSAIV